VISESNFNFILHCSPFVSDASLATAAGDILAKGGLPAPLRVPRDATPGLVRHVYVTSVGDGPRVLAPADALADPTTGLPKVTATKADAAAFAKAL
jgi:hypothetical protein